MDIKELKAQAYDLIATIEFLQGKLKEVNAQIAETAQKQNDAAGNNNNNTN